MAKGALLFVVLGALSLVALSCPVIPYHACVKVDKPKKCIAVEVCEKPKKELCGKYFCEYPFTCASIKKSVCKDFLKLKQKCEIKKVCKEVKIPCGKGACKITHDCVKENVCYIKKIPIGRKLMGEATSNSVAIAKYGSTAASDAKAFAFDDSEAAANSFSLAKDGGKADSKSFAFAEDDSKSKSDAKAIALGDKKEEKKPVFVVLKEDEKKEKEEKKVVFIKPYKEVLVCAEKFTCVAKEPCKDVVIKKCIKDEKKPGIDVFEGGFDFFWYGGHAAEKCGDEYCGKGYKCAEVIIKKCIKPCGDSYCKYGEECITADKECEDYPYLEKICKDVYEPTCVPLTPYLKLHYKAPCKTIFKCEEEPSECGGKYCPKGYACAVDYKKSCDTYVKPIVKKVVEKPVVIVEKPKKVVPIIDVKVDDKKKVGGAFSSSSSKAYDDKAETKAETLVIGDKGKAKAAGKAQTEKSGSLSAAYSDGEKNLAETFTNSYGKKDGVGIGGAKAGVIHG